LAALMIDTGLGVTPEKSYTINRIDLGFFVEE
jgi:restriction endonuclease Mrr